MEEFQVVFKRKEQVTRKVNLLLKEKPQYAHRRELIANALTSLNTFRTEMEFRAYLDQFLQENQLINDFVLLFDLDKFVKKSTKEHLVQFFLNWFLFDKEELNAKLNLAFQKPVFLDRNKREDYIGNVYMPTHLKTLKDRPKAILHLYRLFQVGYLAKLKKLDSFKEGIQQLDAFYSSDFRQENSSQDSKPNAPNTFDTPVLPTIMNLEAFTTLFFTPSKKTKEPKSPKPEIKSKSTLSANSITSREDLITLIIKGIKLLFSESGTRNEFANLSELKRIKFEQAKCITLQEDSLQNLINQVFRIDMYGAVISIFATANAPTGVAVDHQFPDNLGGSNIEENASLIHHKANRIKSDTPWELLDPKSLKPSKNKGDWFSAAEFIELVNEYGIYVMLGRTPFGFDNENIALVCKELHEKLKQGVKVELKKKAKEVDEKNVQLQL